MQTIKGPVKIGVLKDKEDNAEEFAYKLKAENIEIGMPFMAVGWESEKNAELIPKAKIDIEMKKAIIEEEAGTKTIELETKLTREVEEFRKEKKVELQKELERIELEKEKSLKKVGRLSEAEKIIKPLNLEITEETIAPKIIVPRKKKAVIKQSKKRGKR